MSCEYCGALMEHGSVMCMACGAERRELPARSREQARRPEVEVQAMGPTCQTHAGLPLAGSCPRCGKAVCFRCAPAAVTDDFTCHDCVGMTAAHKQAPSGAMCAVHPATGATFICARCGSFACSGCRSWSGAQGYCARCDLGIGAKATRGARFTANLVDNAVVLLMPLFAIFLAGGIAGATKSKEFNPIIFLVAAAIGLMGAGSQLWAQIHWGQSIGKRMLGIKVVRSNGAPIELWRLFFLRNVVVQVVAQMCGLLGLIDVLMIFSEDQRCLHDHIADSIVVVADGK